VSSRRAMTGIAAQPVSIMPAPDVGGAAFDNIDR
jgi:hypothetical protein